jgi:hypothetical protein
MISIYLNNMGDLTLDYYNQNIQLSLLHCRQRAPVAIVLSSSGTNQLGMSEIYFLIGKQGAMQIYLGLNNISFVKM